MKENELQNLEKIAKKSMYAKGVNSASVKYSMEIFTRYISTGSILELGPAEGVATEILAGKYEDITIVEGSSLFCNQLRKRFSDIEVIHSLFEDYKPEREFDNIILGHVLEHVENPCELLKKIKIWLSDSGKIMCAVPNCRSIHRQAAVMMGLLKHEKELNEMDIHHGHRRVYDLESFHADFLNAGLKIEVSGGYWLKPLSNKQIESSWSDEMVNVFMSLGEKYPDIAAELYIIATK